MDRIPAALARLLLVASITVNLAGCLGTEGTYTGASAQTETHIDPGHELDVTALDIRLHSIPGVNFTGRPSGISTPTWHIATSDALVSGTLVATAPDGRLVMAVDVSLHRSRGLGGEVGCNPSGSAPGPAHLFAEAERQYENDVDALASFEGAIGGELRSLGFGDAAWRHEPMYDC